MENTNKKDEYIVKIGNVSKKYYKNGKLHREAGPAILYLVDIDESIEPLDKDLYTEVKEDKKEPVVFIAEKTGHGQNNTNMTKIMKSRNSNNANNPIITFESPIEYIYDFFSNYWLEGINYSKEEFNSILLKKEMEKELSANIIDPKRIKI